MEAQVKTEEVTKTAQVASAEPVLQNVFDTFVVRGKKYTMIDKVKYGMVMRIMQERKDITDMKKELDSMADDEIKATEALEKGENYKRKYSAEQVDNTANKIQEVALISMQRIAKVLKTCVREITDETLETLDFDEVGDIYGELQSRSTDASKKS